MTDFSPLRSQNLGGAPWSAFTRTTRVPLDGQERARTLFQTIKPGIDFDEVVRRMASPATPVESLPPKSHGVTPDMLAALGQAVSALTDDAKLAACGLAFDGKRVKRKGGTGDILLQGGVIDGLKALISVLE